MTSGLAGCSILGRAGPCSVWQSLALSGPDERSEVLVQLPLTAAGGTFLCSGAAGGGLGGAHSISPLSRSRAGSCSTVSAVRCWTRACRPYAHTHQRARPGRTRTHTHQRARHLVCTHTHQGARPQINSLSLSLSHIHTHQNACSQAHKLNYGHANTRIVPYSQKRILATHKHTNLLAHICTGRITNADVRFYTLHTHTHTHTHTYTHAHTRTHTYTHTHTHAHTRTHTRARTHAHAHTRAHTHTHTHTSHSVRHTAQLPPYGTACQSPAQPSQQWKNDCGFVANVRVNGLWKWGRGWRGLGLFLFFSLSGGVSQAHCFVFLCC